MNRIRYLDGLRGLAALLIVLHHYALAFLPAAFSKAPFEQHLPYPAEDWLYNTPLKLPIAGNVWLYVFMILSGVVVVSAFIKSGRRWQKAFLLVANRYLRLIAPILMSGVAIYLVLTFKLAYNMDAATLSQSSWWLGKMWRFDPVFLQMLKQMTIDVFLTVVPMETAYNSSLWVIPFFFKGTFYMAGALVVGNWFKKWRMAVYVLGIYLLRNTFYFPFLIGVALGDYLLPIKPKKIPWWLTTGLGIGFLYFGSYPSWTGRDILSGSWYALLPLITLQNESMFYHVSAAMFLLLVVWLSPSMQQILERPVWQFFGSISYSLYVIHLVLINSWASFLLIRFLTITSYPISLLLVISLALPPTLALAWLMTHIERYVPVLGRSRKT